MANDDFPRGLFPRNLRRDGVHAYRVNTGVDLYLGMPAQIASGLVIGAGVNTAGALRIMGGIVGFLQGAATAPGEKTPYLKSSDQTSNVVYALVADDPDQEFIVQENTNGTALTIANAGSVVPLIYRTTSGNTNSGWANLEFDRNAVVTTTAGQVQLLRPQEGVNTDGTTNAPGSYCKWVVRIINHQRDFYAAQP